jgi:hypothetical protein
MYLSLSCLLLLYKTLAIVTNIGQEHNPMKRNQLSIAIAAISLLLLSAGSSLITARASATTAQLKPMKEETIERDLVLIGPAKDALLRAGFNPGGSIKVFPTEEDLGFDKMTVDIEGLPPNTDFTVFLYK